MRRQGLDSGIGRAFAVLFAKEGADIAIAYLEETDDARETARRIEELSRRRVTIEGDLGDPSHAESTARQVLAEFGRLDILVNNAAQQYYHENFAETPLDEIREMLNSNPLSALVLTQKCLGFMESGSAIVTSTSVTAYRGSYLFLASEKHSGFFTGQVLHPNGGDVVNACVSPPRALEAISSFRQVLPLGSSSLHEYG